MNQARPVIAMAAVLANGLSAIAKTFSGSLCLHRYLRPTALSFDACRFYVASQEDERRKRPTPPFIRYLQSVRPQIARENPEMKITELTKIAASKYKKLSDEQKKELSDSYHEDFLEYQKYLASLPKEEIKKMEIEKQQIKKRQRRRLIHKENKEFNKPKKPMSAFFLFTRDVRQEAGRDQQKGWTALTEIVKEAGARWKKMSDDEKEVYHSAFQKDMAEYQKQLTAWEALMIQKNKLYLVRQRLQPKMRTKKKKKRTVSKKTGKKSAVKKTGKKSASKTTRKGGAKTTKKRTATRKKSTKKDKDIAEKVDPEEHQLSDSE